MINLRILVVDDDPVTRLLLSKTLQNADYEVKLAKGGQEAAQFIDDSYFDVVITDLVMPGGPDGIDVLNKVKEKRPDTEVFLLTGHATVDTAVIAMKKGASDYLQKPVNMDELLLRLKKIRKLKALVKNAGDLREAMDITEKTAGQTIQNLEIQISQYENKILRIKDILSDEGTPTSSRVDKALRSLT